jgi:hypothetical protein
MYIQGFLTIATILGSLSLVNANAIPPAPLPPPPPRRHDDFLDNGVRLIILPASSVLGSDCPNRHYQDPRWKALCA